VVVAASVVEAVGSVGSVVAAGSAVAVAEDDSNA
jgi:hypothetical protein